MAGEIWETPPFRDDYQLAVVDPAFIQEAVRPKQFLHINQAECILCEGCVDICPWKCIHYLSIDVIDEAVNVPTRATSPRTSACSSSTRTSAPAASCASIAARPGSSPSGKFAGSLSAQADELGVQAPWEVDTGDRDFKNGYAYGVRW